MAIPYAPTPHYAKDKLDITLEDIIKNTEGQNPTQAQLNRAKVAAQIQAGIDQYRAQGVSMDDYELIDEDHNSARLARHMEETGPTRPPKCHAHAMVAGKHPLAASLRVKLALFRIRIDDSDNGCWLPENTAATPHPKFTRAPPHSRIHRHNYFFWINARLVVITEPGRFRHTLKTLATMLQQGNFPDYVMLPKGVGLPNSKNPTK